MTDYDEINERAIRFARENQIVDFGIESEIEALVEELILAGADEYEVSVAIGRFAQALNHWPHGCVEAMDHYRKINRHVRLNLMAVGGCSTTPDAVHTTAVSNDQLFDKIRKRGV